MLQIKIVGTDGVIKRMNLEKNSIIGRVTRAVEYEANAIKNTSKEDYLRGPRPQKLAVVTGNLYRSIRSRVYMSLGGNNIVGQVGTNVWYGKAWETGEHRRRAPRRYPKRPFLVPAIEDHRFSFVKSVEKAVRG